MNINLFFLVVEAVAARQTCLFSLLCLITNDKLILLYFHPSIPCVFIYVFLAAKNMIQNLFPPFRNFELPWLDDRSRCRIEVPKKHTPHRTCRKWCDSSRRSETKKNQTSLRLSCKNRCYFLVCVTVVDSAASTCHHRAADLLQNSVCPAPFHTFGVSAATEPQGETPNATQLQPPVLADIQEHISDSADNNIVCTFSIFQTRWVSAAPPQMDFIIKKEILSLLMHQPIGWSSIGGEANSGCHFGLKIKKQSLNCLSWTIQLQPSSNCIVPC